MEPKRSKQDHWNDHLDAWRASGLSQAGYCARHGLKPASLAYWLGKQRQAGAPLTLVPLKLGTVGPVLSGPGGWRLELPADAAPAWLAELLRRLP